MKKTFKRLAATAMAATLMMLVLTAGYAQAPTSTILKQTSSALSSAPASSSKREEVVYANLTAGGAAKEINVVTILHNDTAGTVTDYGNYSTIKNLTNTELMTMTDDQITVNAPKGDLYYQGTLKDEDLPWIIAITYYLDGQEIVPLDLAGKSGHVEIRLTTTQNSKIDPIYFDNYLLQISLTLDTAKCADINAPGATLANAGINKRITYTVMPGKTANLSCDANVTDFSMEGIELAAVPLSLKMDAPDTGDIAKELTTLSDAVNSLNDGIAKLKSGSSELNDGAAELKNGSSAFAGGLKELDLNAQNLVGGSSQIMEALNAIAASLNGSSGSLNLSDLNQLPDGLLQMSSGLDGIALGLSDFKAGFSTSYEALKSAILEIPDETISPEELSKLYEDNPDKKDTLDKLVAFYTSGTQTKSTFDAVRPSFDATGQTLEQFRASISGISVPLSSLATQIKGALDGNATVAQMAQLSGGLTALSDSYKDFHSGLTAYAAGIAALDQNYAALNTGISGLADGTDALLGGISQTNDGTTKLSDAVNDMPEQIDSEIEKLMDQYDRSDLKPVSLASDKNVNTVSVQFVIKTEKIEKIAAPAETIEPAPPSDFWSKLQELFE